MDNFNLGLSAFRKFYDYLKRFHSSKVSFTFDEMMNSYGTKKNIFINGWGDMIKNGDVSSSRLDAALVSLAKSSDGRILKNPIQLVNFIQNQEAKIDWIDAFAFTVTESVKDVGSGLESVGKQIIFTGKILNWFLPVIILGGLYLYVKPRLKK